MGLCFIKLLTLTLQKSVERKSQPKEVDERDDAGPRPCGEREIGRRLISDDTKVSDTLVKLEAPSFTETEVGLFVCLFFSS